MNKEISLIVPLYNVEKYLRKCLDSVVIQTVFRRMEVILVDDGSNDGSLGICEEYSKKYENIITIHKSNGGVSSARNCGIRRASGKYLAFIDADDSIAPDMYGVLLQTIKEGQADMAIVDFFICFPDGTTIKKRNTQDKMAWTREEAISGLLSGRYIGINIFDKLFLREKVKNISFQEGKAVGEDMYYIFEVLLRIDRICADFTGKYFYNKRDGSAMKSEFSKKYFDTIYFSERMIDRVKAALPQLRKEAEAHLIHEQCKTVERMYLYPAGKKFLAQKRELLDKIKHYKLSDAYKYLSGKQFFGLMIMRISPGIYVRVLKMLRIE